tara:strand:- start:72 stop:734 length:663 start_codon:yes stop_codon:yes gene_type:complete
MFAGHKLRRAGGFDLDFVQTGSLKTSTSTANPVVITLVDIGDPHPQRMVAVLINTGGSIGESDVLTCTIGGVSTTVVHERSAAICYAKVPTGTTATVSFTWSGALDQTNLLAYRFNTRETTTLDAVTASVFGNHTIADVECEDGGVVLWCTGYPGTTGTITASWNGTDSLVYDTAHLGSGMSNRKGHVLPTETSTIRDLPVTTGGVGNLGTIVLSFAFST